MDKMDGILLSDKSPKLHGFTDQTPTPSKWFGESQFRTPTTSGSHVSNPFEEQFKKVEKEAEKVYEGGCDNRLYCRFILCVWYPLCMLISFRQALSRGGSSITTQRAATPEQLHTPLFPWIK